MKQTFSFLFFLFLLTGCGYHLAGTGTSLPEHIKTVGVPIFQNNTQGYQVEQKITSAINTLLIQRGKYKVIPEEQGADAVLKGTIISVSLVPVTFTSGGQANKYNVIITAKVTFTDNIDKKILFTNPGFTFRGQYDIDQSQIAFFDRQSQAVDDIAKDFAESVVSAILEGF
ncbi:MAG TPA: LptE family protein [Acidobacteriota bacterium]|nr:LptE family protein [Acidobacteriota bacterium]